MPRRANPSEKARLHRILRRHFRGRVGISRGIACDSGCDRRDQRCIVIAHRVDPRRHRMPRHRVGRERREQVGDVEIGGVEPARVVFGRRRSPASARESAAAAHWQSSSGSCRYRAPRRRRASQRSNRPAKPNGAPSLRPTCTGCLPPARRLPLVEAVGRNQAPMLAKGGAERRLLGDRFGARVDHLRADRRILGPARHEAPAHLDASSRVPSAR